MSYTPSPSLLHLPPTMCKPPRISSPLSRVALHTFLPLLFLPSVFASRNPVCAGGSSLKQSQQSSPVASGSAPKNRFPRLFSGGKLLPRIGARNSPQSEATRGFCAKRFVKLQEVKSRDSVFLQSVRIWGSFLSTVVHTMSSSSLDAAKVHRFRLTVSISATS